jgi:flavin reductase ActVB
MIAAEDFKRTLAHLAGAVTIITTCDATGRPYGFTATSCCSLSLEPPLVLFCLGRSAECYRIFAGMEPIREPAAAGSPPRGQRFAVNLLAAQQQALAQLFATKGPAKYRQTRFLAGRTGMPLLPDALATLEGQIRNVYPGGDHSIFVGLVEHASLNLAASTGTESASAEPLLYYLHRYGTFSALTLQDQEQYFREGSVNNG